MPETSLEKRSVILLDKVRKLDAKVDVIVNMLRNYLHTQYFNGKNIDGNKVIEYANRVQKLTVEKETILRELNK